jgi:hypothetical protein
MVGNILTLLKKGQHFVCVRTLQTINQGHRWWGVEVSKLCLSDEFTRFGKDVIPTNGVSNGSLRHVLESLLFLFRNKLQGESQPI